MMHRQISIRLTVYPSIPPSLADSQHNQDDKYQLLWIQYQDPWRWTVSEPEAYRAVYQDKVKK